MTSIDIKVTGASIVASAEGNLTSGMVGIDVRIEYDSSWDRLSKTAIFRAGRFERSRENIGTTTTVPWEVVRHHGKLLQVGIVGKDADGNIVMPTIWTSVGTILPGANEAIPGAPNPDRPDDPTGGGAAIDDGVVSPDKTWSSRKIASEISNAGAALINNTRIDDASTWSSKNIVDKLCPSFTESGSIVTCEPVEGYPLEVTAEEGATQITRCGKNVFGGNALVDILKSKDNGGGVTVDEANKTVKFNPGKMVRTEPLFAKFKENTQYTIILYGYNSAQGEVTNLNINYTDGTFSPVSNIGGVVDVPSYIRIVSDKIKTLAGLRLTWANGLTTLFYDQCGIFEGDVSLEEFEAYMGKSLELGEQISALPGVNTLWADAGNITVKGKADPVAIIKNQNARIAALEAALVNT